MYGNRQKFNTHSPVGGIIAGFWGHLCFVFFASSGQAISLTSDVTTRQDCVEYFRGKLSDAENICRHEYVFKCRLSTLPY